MQVCVGCVGGGVCVVRSCGAVWCGVVWCGVVCMRGGWWLVGAVCVFLVGCVCVCGVIWDGVLCVLAGVCGVLCSRAPDMI